MLRTQISVTEEQLQALRRIARGRGVSMAAVIREAVDGVIERDDRRARWEQALAAVGKYRGSGATDGSVNHDRYLGEAYLDWRSSPIPRRSTRSSTQTTRTTSPR